MSDNGRWWCKYYNGVPSKKCEIGIIYETVGHGLSYPCFRPELNTCKKREYLSDKEWSEHEAEVQATITKFTDYMTGKTSIYPHCGQEVVYEEQIGRCAYGRPCGCRLFQGKARGRIK